VEVPEAPKIISRNFLQTPEFNTYYYAIMETTFIDSTAGEILASTRNKAGLSLHELGEAANVPFSYVWAIENGKRRVGTKVATRLASALKMPPKEMDRFLLVVAHEAKRNKATAQAVQAPQSLLNALAAWITPHIKNEAIESCFTNVKLNELPADLAAKLLVHGGPEFRPDVAIKTSKSGWLFIDAKFVRV